MNPHNGDTSTCMDVAGIYQFLDNIENAETYYLLADEKGEKYALQQLAFMYKNGINGEGANFEKAEGYFLMAHKKGHLTDNSIFAELYQLGVNGEGANFEKAEEYYLKNAEKGESGAYISLGSLYQDGADGQGRDFQKAEKYYLIANEKQEGSADSFLASLYHSGINGQFIDLDKAVLYYTKCIKKGEIYVASSLGSHYLNGWEGHPAEPEKAIHYLTLALERGEEQWKDDLTKLCIPADLGKGPIYPSVAKQKAKIINKWTALSTILENMIHKMIWKEDSEHLFADLHSLQEVLPSENQASIICENRTDAVKEYYKKKQEHYKNYLKTLQEAPGLMQKALAEDTFAFMTPKTGVQEHLRKTFTLSDPLNPINSDESGLCIYNLDNHTVLAFGNENVAELKVEMQH